MIERATVNRHLARAAQCGGLLVLLALLSGCLSTRVPMPALSYRGPASSGQTLVIALRGLGGSMQDFEHYGFVEALFQAYPDYDLICPDAHLGYYRDHSLLTRLQDDVIEPARARGYRKFYLVGVSMGGLGSLLTLREYPQQYAGAVLISPYSGEKALHAAVDSYRAGTGPAPWTLQQNDRDRDLALLWQWLLGSEELLQSGKVWLAYGRQDRLSGHAQLSRLLPADRVIAVEGSHRAELFAQLWRDVLAQRPFH